MTDGPGGNVTRRGFQAGLAALTAGRGVLGAPKIRAAVFGAGHAHAAGKVAALRALPHFDFVGICEPDRTVSRQRKAFEGARWLSERELLDDPTIELIAVESRVQQNLHYARMSIDAGKHVHLDKPPGRDLRVFRDLISRAAQWKLAVQLGYQWRYQPAMCAAIDAARKGWLGHVYMVRSIINKPTAAPERLELAAFRGGMMFELGCHMIDRTVDLLGKPGQVIGILRHDAPVADTLADNTLAILEYGRALCEIHVAAMQPNGNAYRTFEIMGTNGTATVRPFGPRVLFDLGEAAGPYRAGPQTVETADRHGLPYAADFLELAAFIRNGEKLSYEAGHDSLVQEILLEVCHEL